MKKLSSETIAKIHSFHEAGMSERAIAKATGCSRSAVWYQLTKPRTWFEVRDGGASSSFGTLKEAKAYLADMTTGFLTKHPKMTDENRAYWKKAAPRQKIFQVTQTSKEVR